MGGTGRTKRMVQNLNKPISLRMLIKKRTAVEKKKEVKKVPALMTTKEKKNFKIDANIQKAGRAEAKALKKKSVPVSSLTTGQKKRLKKKAKTALAIERAQGDETKQPKDSINFIQ